MARTRFPGILCGCVLSSFNRGLTRITNAPDGEQAFKEHKIVDPLTSPGECDLTTNVDFALLREAVGDAASTYGPITQHAFLTRMGIHARVAQLQAAARANESTVLSPGNAGKESEGSERIEKGAKRLLDLTGMGVQYNVLGMIGYGGRTPQEGEERVWPFEE